MSEGGGGTLPPITGGGGGGGQAPPPPKGSAARRFGFGIRTKPFNWGIATGKGKTIPPKPSQRLDLIQAALNPQDPDSEFAQEAVIQRARSGGERGFERLLLQARVPVTERAALSSRLRAILPQEIRVQFDPPATTVPTMPDPPATTVPTMPRTPITFDPIGAVIRGTRKGLELRAITQAFLSIASIGRGGGSPRGGGAVSSPSAAPRVAFPSTSPPPSAIPPRADVFQPTGGIAMPFSFGESDLNLIPQVLTGIAGVVGAARGGNGSAFNLPGVDITSPIQLESTTRAEAGCQDLMAQFRATCNGTSATGQTHVAVNPLTGKLQWFSPVKLGKPQLMGRRRRRSCACPTRRRRRSR